MHAKLSMSIVSNRYVKCIHFNQLYSYLCESDSIGIYSARSYLNNGPKCLDKSLFIKCAIIIDTRSIYDDDNIIIQAIQHLF